MEIKNKAKKRAEHAPNIIFGILCGSGLFLIAAAGVSLIIRLIPVLDSYFLAIFVFLYFFLLVSTSLLSSKGWFRVTYIITALLLLLRYILIYTEILGVI